MSDARRSSDDLLLQLIREGRPDAEIGVRLGINSGDVRERKAELRRRMGDDAYFRALQPPKKAPRLTRKRKRILAALGVVIVLFGALLLVANLFAGGDEEIAEVRSSITPTPQPTAKAAASVLVDGEPFDDAGPFLALASGGAGSGVGQVENRDTLSVVHLHGTAYISPSEFAPWSLLSGGRGQLRLFSSEFAGRSVSVLLNTANTSTRLRGLLAGVGPIAEVTSQFDAVQPAVFVRAYDQEGRQLRTRLTEDGRLQISHQPVPLDWVVDRTSGVRMNTADAVPFGEVQMLAGVGATTVCDLPGDSLRCGVLWVRAQGIQVPFDGQFICATPTVLRYEAEGIRLEFSMQLNAARIGGSNCPSGSVAALATIVPDGDWEIRASTLAGEPLSAGVLNDGTLLVGRFTGTRACPCLTQP